LCVCSHKEVDLSNDSINIDKTDVGFKVDTDPELVRKFLERETDDIKIIFSTYHSTKVVVEGAAGLPPIDLRSLTKRTRPPVEMAACSAMRWTTRRFR
jgi:predicted helicase